MAWPLGTEIYWWPSMDQVMGVAAVWPPREQRQRSFPLVASRAKKWPSRLPEKRRLGAVVRRQSYWIGKPSLVRNFFSEGSN